MIRPGCHSTEIAAVSGGALPLWPPEAFDSRHKRATAFFLILLGAAGLFFGLPNTLAQFPPLAALYPACLYALSGLAQSPRKAFFLGWLAGLAANAACLYWLVFPMIDVAAMPWPLAMATAFLLHCYLALYAGLTLCAFWGLRRYFSSGITGLLLPPLLGGLAFAGLEVACSFIFTGFPWLTLGLAVAFTPFWAQTVSLWGAHGLSALLACSACFAVAALLDGGRLLKGGASQNSGAARNDAATHNCSASQDGAARNETAALTARRLRVALLTGAALIPLALMAAFGLHARQQKAGDGPLLPLVMIQGNIDQAVKWNPDFQKATLEHFLELSRRALQKARREHPDQAPALVVWPETAMPFIYHDHYPNARILRDFAESQGLYLAFGAPGLDFADSVGLHRNRFLLLPPDGGLAQWYDKRHLVPFGEYLPFFALLAPYLPELLQGMSFTPGSSSRPLLMAAPGGRDDLSLGALICYEAIFPALAAESVAAGADILINVSNDGWFRKSAAPYQHLAHAVLRAVEQRRPLIRATNTGVSAVIGADGQLEMVLDGLFVTGFMRATVRANRETTPYQALRPLPEALLLAAAAAALAMSFQVSRRAGGKKTLFTGGLYP